VALLAWTALITLLSLIPAFPLRELANPNVTPNPSKAPWYFLGLQELLRYFHPMVAGVTIPGIVGLLGLMMFPYLDKNPSVRPENRKTAYMAFTFYMVFWGVLTIIGSFFRGPGFNWVWPWVDGLWFVL
jgi:quinol-cytochrome oxidoreductase complex cytochrome b subunit